MYKILIIEDDKKILAYLSAILTANDYVVLKAENGKTGISMAASHNPDIILLDLSLPDIDGIKIIRHIREWTELPIIVVSARQGERDKVDALDSGANDYVTKPFGNGELLARIRAAIRVSKYNEASRISSIFICGGLRVEFVNRAISINGRPVHLTPIEYKIVVMLAQNAGKVMTHDYLLSVLWGPYTPDSQILRVNVANIRRKIEENPAEPKYIITEIGVGYKMAAEG